MPLANRYSPTEIEQKWYDHWMEKNYFHSEPDERESYTILIPPPNVTGVLHMGHMLNNTIQDLLVRKARLDGKNACWVPGTDHASIATEAKVVRWLREEKGLTKGDVGRDEFLKYCWQWTDKYGGIILQQLRKLGASCDWERTTFTMDESRYDAVIKIFVDLYRKGKLYRGLRMVNWDPKAKTVVSNEEVLYENEKGKLYHVRYPVVGERDKWLTIATTRPETILADTALAVHPEDDRYAGLEGVKVRIPLIDREIPIIRDDYVDREFGTGALKITPAHDPNDYEIGLRHGLEVIDMFNENGTLNEKAGLFVGEDRFEARKSMVKALEEGGFLVDVEDYEHAVGRSERTKAIIEPKLSLQWYVKMKELAGPALESVMKDDVRFFPENQKNTYRHWMENVRDWCISRQLWWGHRIPAWYYKEETFVAETVEEALDQARKHFEDENIQSRDLRQDEDVLDTWFSSWLWPISVFHGFRSREELEYYYPTSVLVTAWDIIFLWVARMIMAGYEWEQEKPFHDVYFTGMVRDQQRRKMSKSLGNSPDALKLIETYGADGVRFGMLSCSPAGGDLLFDEKLCEQGRNFCNKIWNALRLTKTWSVEDKAPDEVHLLADTWLKDRVNKMLAETEKDYEGYRLADILMKLYSLIWDDFCSWYLEMIKPAYGKPIDRETLELTNSIFEKLMIMLHPFMPFVTEELWHRLNKRADGEDIIVTKYPTAGPFDEILLKDFDQVRIVIRKVRELRNKYGIKNQEKIKLEVQDAENARRLYKRSGMVALLTKMANLESFTTVADSPDSDLSFVSGTEKYFVTLEQHVDKEAEKERLTKELQHAEGFVLTVRKKLDNKRFVQNAPEAVVTKERQKLTDGEERIRILKESLGALGS